MIILMVASHAATVMLMVTLRMVTMLTVDAVDTAMMRREIVMDMARTKLMEAMMEVTRNTVVMAATMVVTRSTVVMEVMVPMEANTMLGMIARATAMVDMMVVTQDTVVARVMEVMVVMQGTVVMRAMQVTVVMIMEVMVRRNSSPLRCRRQ